MVKYQKYILQYIFLIAYAFNDNLILMLIFLMLIVGIEEQYY